MEWRERTTIRMKLGEFDLYNFPITGTAKAHADLETWQTGESCQGCKAKGQGPERGGFTLKKVLKGRRETT